MTTAERIDQILARPEWPTEPSDALVERAVRVWASIQPAQEAA